LDDGGKGTLKKLRRSLYGTRKRKIRECRGQVDAPKKCKKKLKKKRARVVERQGRNGRGPGEKSIGLVARERGRKRGGRGKGEGGGEREREREREGDSGKRNKRISRSSYHGGGREGREAAPGLVSRMSGWQFRGADPVSHGVRLVFH